MKDFLNLINDIPGLVIFTICNIEYCIDVKDVKYVERYSQIFSHRITSELKYLDQDFRVVDTHSFLKEYDFPSSMDRRILLCRICGKNIALIVDDVLEFLTLDSLFIEKTIEFTECSKDYNKWELRFEDRTIYYPDYEYISKNIDHLQYKDTRKGKIILPKE
jgi:chemotaxis signal transduction protein